MERPVAVVVDLTFGVGDERTEHESIAPRRPSSSTRINQSQVNRSWPNFFKAGKTTRNEFRNPDMNVHMYCTCVYVGENRTLPKSLRNSLKKTSLYIYLPVLEIRSSADVSSYVKKVETPSTLNSIKKYIKLESSDIPY